MKAGPVLLSLSVVCLLALGTSCEKSSTDVPSGSSRDGGTEASVDGGTRSSACERWRAVRKEAQTNAPHTVLEAHCTELDGRAWVVELRQQSATPLFCAVFQAEPASAAEAYVFSTDFMKEPLARPFLSVRTIDMDGNARPELFIRAGQQLGSGETQSAGTLLQVERETIREYLPARGYSVEDVQDFDGDGRPDLLLGFVLRGDPPIKRCALSRQSWGTLLFLGHAQPDGGISLTDEVAVRYALQQCPARPEPPYYRQGQPLADVMHTYSCARLWQVDSRTLKKSFQDACRSQAREMANCQGACGALQGHIHHLAQFQPPLSLPR